VPEPNSSFVTYRTSSLPEASMIDQGAFLSDCPPLRLRTTLEVVGHSLLALRLKTTQPAVSSVCDDAQPISATQAEKLQQADQRRQQQRAQREAAAAAAAAAEAQADAARRQAEAAAAQAALDEAERAEREELERRRLALEEENRLQREAETREAERRRQQLLEAERQRQAAVVGAQAAAAAAAADARRQRRQQTVIISPWAQPHMCLAATARPGGTVASANAAICLQPYDAERADDSQHWALVPDPMPAAHPQFHICSPATAMHWDVSCASTAAGEVVEQWHGKAVHQGDRNQVFALHPRAPFPHFALAAGGRGPVALQAVHSGLFLGLSPATNANKIGPNHLEQGPHAAQSWMLRPSL
jgi:hypothetical protein